MATVSNTCRWDGLLAGKHQGSQWFCPMCESVSFQSSPTLCDPMDCSLPGSSVHGIFQARILEWVAIPFSMGSSRLRLQTWVSCIIGRFFTICSTREAHYGELYNYFIKSQFNNIKYIVSLSHSVMSETLWSQGLYSTRLLCPWNFLGKNTGVGCHFLF